MEKIMKKRKQTVSFRDLYAFGTKLPIDLSLSENPLGCSPKVLSSLKKVSQVDCFDYPDPDSNRLKAALSEKFGVDPNRLFIANGSESIIKLLPQVLLDPEDEVIIPKLTFPMLEKAVRMAGGKVVLSDMTKQLDIDLMDIKNKITDKTRLIFICNPNNPTGRVIDREFLLGFMRSVKPLVIVDEANIEFGGETVIGDSNTIENLIVLRTFSKGFGLAGFRVGFCVARQEIIKSLRQVGQPFAVAVLSQRAAIAALSDDKFIKKTKSFMGRERVFLTNELRKRSFEVINSQANNLLVKVTKLFDSSDEFVAKLNKQGVSVVNGTSFKFLGNGFVRISPRTRKTNKLLVTAIDNILEK